MNELLKIKGIGNASIQKLKLNGIESIRDLINTFPAKYQSMNIDAFSQMEIGKEITLSMVVMSLPVVSYIRKRLTKMIFSAMVDNQLMKISIFNREFLKNSLTVNSEIVVTGKFSSSNQMVATNIIKKSHFQCGIIASYRLEDISSKVFSKWVEKAIIQYPSEIRETIPDRFLKKNEIVDISTFFRIVHHPMSLSDVDNASRRIKYEELLEFFLRLAVQKQNHMDGFVKRKHYQIDMVRHYIESLPFELTSDQKEATNEIFRDLKSDHQMNRLLQGDVGSGKTVCAMIASYAVYTAHEQVALMAPTEILALQHYHTFFDSLSPYGVKVAFLSSSVTGTERSTILEELANGNIDIVCGTHSLIQPEVVFKNLGFIIIDEQHRFGVNQRRELRKKGMIPDVLFMSATPIPRTLAITIFKDMDISSIRMMPKGRKQIQTNLLAYDELDYLFTEIQKELDLGHQAYIIVPLIEDSEGSKNISLQEFKAIIGEKLPSKYSVDFLHGKMNYLQKEKVLELFYKNETSVLVSTTVVEVGVNVTNATIMAIVNANQFGLSQLHQLRGRVGRGNVQAYCYLITDGLPEENSRLEILTQTTDGFAISEADLRYRGPGEIFGSEQTGIPKFKMANFITDQELIASVMEDAIQILHSSDPLAEALREKSAFLLETTHLD